MDLTWNLDTLYTSFNSPKFKGDVELLNHHIANLNQWAEENLKDTNRPAFKIEEFLKLYNEYKSLYSCLSCYAYLILNSDSSNIEAMNVLDDIEYKDSAVTESFVRFNKWLISFNNIDELIDTSSYLLEHGFYLKELLLQSKYLLSEEAEIIIGKMQSINSDTNFKPSWMDLKNYCTNELHLSSNFGMVSNPEIGTLFIAGFLAPMFLQEIDGKKIGSLSTGLYGILRGLGIDQNSVVTYSKALHTNNFLLIIRGNKDEMIALETLLKI